MIPSSPPCPFMLQFITVAHSTLIFFLKKKVLIIVITQSDKRTQPQLVEIQLCKLDCQYAICLICVVLSVDTKLKRNFVYKIVGFIPPF